jgi:hypothetical protein
VRANSVRSTPAAVPRAGHTVLAAYEPKRTSTRGQRERTHTISDLTRPGSRLSGSADRGHLAKKGCRQREDAPF